MLWKNYIIIERFKRNNYLQKITNNSFWRTYDKKEIDFIKEYNGQLHGYEIKGAKQKTTPPKTWLETYNQSTYKIISKKII